MKFSMRFSRLFLLSLFVLLPGLCFAWWPEWICYESPMVSGDGRLVAYEAHHFMEERVGDEHDPLPTLFVVDTTAGETWALTHDVQLFETTPRGGTLFSTFWGVFLTSSDGRTVPRQLLECFPQEQNRFDSREAKVMDIGIMPDQETIVAVIADSLLLKTSVYVGTASQRRLAKLFTDARGYRSRLSPDCRFLIVDDRYIVRITPEAPRSDYEVPGRILGFLPDDEGVVFEKDGRRFVLSLKQEDEPKARELSEKKTSSLIRERSRPSQAGDWKISLCGGKLSAKNSNIGQKVQLTIPSGRLRAWEKGSHRLFVDEIDAETKKSVGIVLLRADSSGDRPFIHAAPQKWWDHREFGSSPYVFIREVFSNVGHPPANEIWIWDERDPSSAPRILAPRRTNY